MELPNLFRISGRIFNSGKIFSGISEEYPATFTWNSPPKALHTGRDSAWQEVNTRPLMPKSGKLQLMLGEKSKMC